MFTATVSMWSVHTDADVDTDRVTGKDTCRYSHGHTEWPLNQRTEE